MDDGAGCCGPQGVMVLPQEAVGVACLLSVSRPLATVMGRRQPRDEFVAVDNNELPCLGRWAWGGMLFVSC